MLQPENQFIEYIKSPKVDSLAKIIGAYEEYYRLKKKFEQRKAFREIDQKLSTASIVVFIRGTP